MKLSDSIRFAHPVFDANTGDYTSGELETSLSVAEHAEAGCLAVKGRLEVTSPELASLVSAEQVLPSLLVCCLDTYYVQQHPIPVGDFSLDLPPGQLRGSVTFRILLTAVAETVTLPKEGLHPEFEGSNLTIGRGDIVGIGEEFQYEAGLDKLAPLESVFKLVKKPDLLDPRFEIDVDGQAVQIAVPSSLYDQITTLRTGPARNILLSSLFLPCLIELLAIAHIDPRPELRWFQAIEARCRKLNILLDGKDLATKAQQLLNNPLGLLYAAIEGAH